MPQASDSTVWVAAFSPLGFVFASVLAFALAVVFAALGQLRLERRSQCRPHWHAGVLAAVLAGLLMAGSGANGETVAASVAAAMLGAWLMRARNLTRQPCRVALLGSCAGLAVMAGGFARYLSSADQLTMRANAERIELYAAVFIGALIFATSTVAYFKLRGASRLAKVARPGHDMVNLLSLLLCGWLGYGFVTEQAQPFGIAALLAMSALACSMGVHVMLSREFSSRSIIHGKAHALPSRDFPARRDGQTAGKVELLTRIEWRGGDEQTWALRELASGKVRAAAYRHRRGLLNNESSHDRRRGSTRSWPNHVTIFRRR